MFCKNVKFPKPNTTAKNGKNRICNITPLQLKLRTIDLKVHATTKISLIYHEIQHLEQAIVVHLDWNHLVSNNTSKHTCDKNAKNNRFLNALLSSPNTFFVKQLIVSKLIHRKSLTAKRLRSKSLCGKISNQVSNFFDHEKRVQTIWYHRRW